MACRAGDPGAVDNWSHSFPMSNQGQSQPYILWPYTLEQPEGPLKGYIQLPASWFEPVWGAYWAINNVTLPIENQINAAADAFHFQNIDEYFPGIYNWTITNPLTPVKDQYEAVRQTIKSAHEAVMTPVNAIVLDLNQSIVAPTAQAMRQGGLAVTSALAPSFLGAVTSIPNIDTGFGTQAPIPSAIRSISDEVVAAIDSNDAIVAARKVLTGLFTAPAPAPEAER